MTDVWNMREVREYPGGFSGNAFEAVRHWIVGQNFKITNSDKSLLKAEKRGIHVNFMPELTLVFSNSAKGSQVSLNYSAHVTVAKAAVFGILTGGLTTVVGAGTFTAHVADAAQFVRSMFSVLEGLAAQPSIVLSRTGFDDTKSAPVTGSPTLPPKPQSPAPYSGQQPGYSPYPPQHGYPPQQGYPQHPQQQPGGYPQQQPGGYPQQQPGGYPQQPYPAPYGQAPAYGSYPHAQQGQQPAAPQQFEQPGQSTYPQYPQYSPHSSGNHPSAELQQSGQLTQQMGGLTLSGQQPGQQAPASYPQQGSPYPEQPYPQQQPAYNDQPQQQPQQQPQPQPALSSPVVQPAARTSLVPSNPDFKTLSTEELDQLLSYHKDTAWKIEREIMERKNRV